jgi:hypothetical protein
VSIKEKAPGRNVYVRPALAGRSGKTAETRESEKFIFYFKNWKNCLTNVWSFFNHSLNFLYRDKMFLTIGRESLVRSNPKLRDTILQCE